jgi:hypothetical protein
MAGVPAPGSSVFDLFTLRLSAVRVGAVGIRGVLPLWPSGVGGLRQAGNNGELPRPEPP